MHTGKKEVRKDTSKECRMCMKKGVTEENSKLGQKEVNKRTRSCGR